MKRLKLKTNPYFGKLIVFEGMDGEGKTTMISMTEQYMAAEQGREKVLTVKQPTDFSRKTKLFQKMMYCEEHLDIDYRAVQLLTMSDRIQQGVEVIEPALKEGKTVICDCYIYTSLANMLARGYQKEKWFFDAAKYLLKPDLVFLAYVSPELAIEQVDARPSECHRYFDKELMYRVTGEFLRMAKREKFYVLDTGGEKFRLFSTIRSALGQKGVSI